MQRNAITCNAAISAALRHASGGVRLASWLRYHLALVAQSLIWPAMDSRPAWCCDGPAAGCGLSGWGGARGDCPSRGQPQRATSRRAQPPAQPASRAANTGGQAAAPQRAEGRRRAAARSAAGAGRRWAQTRARQRPAARHKRVRHQRRVAGRTQRTPGAQAGNCAGARSVRRTAGAHLSDNIVRWHISILSSALALPCSFGLSIARAPD